MYVGRINLINAIFMLKWDFKGLKPCGSISYMHQSERGIHPQTEFVFDLELPQQFVPENQDGEVQDWILCPVSNILDIITSEVKNFFFTKEKQQRL